MVRKKLYTYTTKKGKLETLSENILLLYFILVSVGYFFIFFTNPIAFYYDPTASDDTITYIDCNNESLREPISRITLNNTDCGIISLANEPLAKDEYLIYYYAVSIQWYIILWGVLHILLFKREVLKRKWEKILNYMERIK